LIRVNSVKKMKKTYVVEAGDEIMVKRGRKVKEGEALIVRANKEEVKAIHEGKVEIVENKVMLLIDKEIEEEYLIENANDVLIKDGEYVEAGRQLTYGSVYPKELLTIKGIEAAQKYVIDGVQEVYGIQGIAMDDKHLEITIRQMSRFAVIDEVGDSNRFLPGDYADILDIEEENVKTKSEGKRPIEYTRTIQGLTTAAVKTESFLSAASFQEQVRVLTEAALIGKVDKLRGLKENVIIGRPVPLGKYADDYNN
jgi:DNA-directed RNA polymerase subunit beta'